MLVTVRRIIQENKAACLGMLVIILLVPAFANGQSTGKPVDGGQVLWPGLVLRSDVGDTYSLSVFGIGELRSPRLYRNSEYIAGVRLSHVLSDRTNLGFECLQDRSYASDSGLLIESRCAVDITRRRQSSPKTRVYVQPKFEFRSIGGKPDERLKARVGAIREIRLCGAKVVHAYGESAFDPQFDGFEKFVGHAGIFWVASENLRIEFFDAVTIAKRPEPSVNAARVILYVQLRTNDKNRRDEGR